MSKMQVTYSNVVRSQPRPEISLSGEELGRRGRYLENVVIGDAPVELLQVERRKHNGSSYEYEFDVTVSVEGLGDAPEVGEKIVGELADALSDTAWLCTSNCHIMSEWKVSQLAAPALASERVPQRTI